MNWKVTAVLPTYNNEKTIKRCLKSVIEQSHKPFEIIAVDDGSSDGTVRILRRHSKIKVIAKRHTHRPKNLNIGIKMAKGDAIFIVETDAYYEKNYLKKCLSKMCGEGIAGAIGKIYCTRPKENFWRKVRDIELRIRYNDYMPFTAWVYKKKVLREVGGYDEDLYVHDDFILGRKVRQKGYTIAWVPEAKWWHEEKVTPKDMWRQRIKWGIGTVPLLVKYHHLPKAIPVFTAAILLLPLAFAYPTAWLLYLLGYVAFALSYSRKAVKVTKNPFYMLLIPLLKIYRGTVTALGFWYGVLLKAIGADLLKHT